MESVKICPGCGNECTVFESLCSHCGADLTTVVSLVGTPHVPTPTPPIPGKTCPDPQCGASNPPGQQTCLYCGARLDAAKQSDPVSVQVTWPWGTTMLNAPLAVGRDPSFSPLAAQLADYLDISRVHGLLRPLPDGSLEIEDLGSKYGTLVDGIMRRDERILISTDTEVRFSQAFTVHRRFFRT